MAYVRPSGVYFNTNTDLIQYGKMKHTADLDTNDGNSYQRIETNKDKISQNDFALWKITNEDSSFLWDSPWGKGRPGWHIECSAMITSLFNDKLDVLECSIAFILIGPCWWNRFEIPSSLQRNRINGRLLLRPFQAQDSEMANLYDSFWTHVFLSSRI